MTLGVGILGCGPVTQAIHLPTLATLTGRLRVVHVMDVDARAAGDVGARAGARWTTNVGELLADPEVEVVAVCSPHEFHAEQVEAACAAGKKAVLCEKPLAVDEQQAERIALASRSSGVPVVVGTMHVYDPAVRAAAAEWGDLAATARLVRSVILLPPNERFIELSTEMQPAPPAIPETMSPDVPLSGRILTLATHDLPLIRGFAPVVDDIHVARPLTPSGYDIAYRSGEVTVQLLASFHGHWRPDWTLAVWGTGLDLHIEFPPSYVLAGSATVTLRTPSCDRRWSLPESGYQAEWQHVADIADELCAPAVEVEEAAADLRYALDLVSITAGVPAGFR